MVAYLYNLGVKRQYGGDACAGHSYIHPQRHMLQDSLGEKCRLRDQASEQMADLFTARYCTFYTRYGSYQPTFMLETFCGTC